MHCSTSGPPLKLTMMSATRGDPEARHGTGGTSGAGGGTSVDSGAPDVGGAGGAGGTGGTLDKFSFFVTSMKAMLALAKKQNATATMAYQRVSCRKISGGRAQ